MTVKKLESEEIMYKGENKNHPLPHYPETTALE